MTQEAATHPESTVQPVTPRQLGHSIVGASAPSHEALDDAAVLAMVADMDKVKSVYYRNPDISKAEREASIDAYEAAIPSTAAVYHALHIPEMPGINMEGSMAFRKEGVFEVSIDQYRIGVDHDGSEWMLKWGGHRNDSKAPKLEALMSVERMQDEVYAARIGHVIGYPLVETRIVQQDDRPWLAVRFMPNVRDHWMAGPDSRLSNRYKGIQPQPEHLVTRPIYNALVNATRDSAKQGLIDQKTGEYYAMDTRVSLPEGACLESDEAVADQMITSMKRGYFGPFKMSKYVQPLADTIRGALEDGSLRTVFDGYIGRSDRPRELADHLEQRARVVLAIFDGPDAAEFEYEPDFVLANTGPQS